MPNPITPVVMVTKLDRHLSGNVLDFGHCYTEQPAAQWGDPEYTFEGCILEPNTNTIITKPELDFQTSNGFDNWNTSGGYWSEVTARGWLERTVIKWSMVTPDQEYTASTKSYGDLVFGKDEPCVIEFLLLPTREATAEPTVSFTLGNVLRITIDKSGAPLIDYNSGGTWLPLGRLSMAYTFTWNDLHGQLLWVAPYMGGFLFSTDGTSWQFLRPPSELSLPDDYTILIHGSGGVACFAVHKVTISAMSVTSKTIDMMYTPLNEAEVVVRGWVSDAGAVATGSITSVSDSQYKYTVAVAPGNAIAGIQKVGVNHDPSVTISTADETVVYGVESLEESIPEDPSDESCTVVLANDSGSLDGAFKRFDMLKWHIGWAYDDGTSVVTLRNKGLVTDVSATRRAESRQVTLRLSNMLYPIKDGTVIFAPDYAGWTFTDMLKDFFARHGVPESDLSIYEWTDTLPDLPKQGGTQPQFGSRSWDWLEETVYNMLGGWIYARRDGLIRIEPYPDVDDDTWSGLFDIYPYQVDNIMFSQPEAAIKDFRNRVVVQGLDADLMPLAAVMDDPASLYDPLSSKYVGYLKPFVYSLPFPATSAFVQYVCSVLFEQLDRLRNTVQFTTNPRAGAADVYPGARVRIYSDFEPVIKIIVRVVSTRMVHGEMVQTVMGHYIEED